MSQQDEERRELKPCPCGETPTKLLIQADHDQPKYAVCFGDCCNEWWVEFRNQYCKLDSAETMERAIERWNAAPRRAPEHEKAAPMADQPWPAGVADELEELLATSASPPPASAEVKK